MCTDPRISCHATRYRWAAHASDSTYVNARSWWRVESQHTHSIIAIALDAIAKAHAVGGSDGNGSDSHGIEFG